MATSRASYAYMESDIFLKNMSDMWFNEHKDCPETAIKSYPKEYEAIFGNFTQMVQDKADRVGCAIMRYFRNSLYVTYLVCNYSYGNVDQEPVYVSGPACSECPVGNSIKYPGLCRTENTNDAIEELERPPKSQSSRQDSQPIKISILFCIVYFLFSYSW